MVEFLVQAGLEVNAPHFYLPHQNPLLSAVMNGAFQTARWLLDRGATIHSSPTEVGGGGTLVSAIYSGSIELVQLLLDHGADVHGNFGDPLKTALSFAIMYGRTEIADLLRKYGATFPQPPDSPLPPTLREQILHHISAHFGRVNNLALTEIVPGNVALQIHVVEPTPQRNCLTLITSGMSERPMKVPKEMEDYRYAEVMIQLPSDWPIQMDALSDKRNYWPIEWLRRIAHYPHEQGIWFGPGNDVLVNGEPTEPLASHLSFDSILLLHELGDFGTLATADGRQIHFYNLFPLYPEERIVDAKEGRKALLQRFVNHGISTVIDVNRPNVG